MELNALILRASFDILSLRWKKDYDRCEVCKYEPQEVDKQGVRLKSVKSQEDKDYAGL
jgi:hypothetical protein